MTRSPKTVDHFNWAQIAALSWEHFSPRQIIDGYKAKYPPTSDFTFTYEGGYVNDPDDPGGCTNMGITIGTLRAWRQDDSVNCEDVKTLTKSEAALIYATNYWAPVWGNELPVGVNTQVYDFGVNAGPSTAVKKLQTIIGSPADGGMGPNTLAATEDYVSKNGVGQLLSKYREARQAYYESLSTFSKYGNGWTTRNNDCYALSIDLSKETPVVMPSLPGIPDSGLAAQVQALNRRVTDLENWRKS